MLMNAYILVILSNFAFALGSQFFTHYTKKFSSSWMNAFKAIAAMVFFGITITFISGWNPITSTGFSLLFLSGFIGLGIGDIFLLRAFAKIGPGRTLMLFSFQPIYIGLVSYLLFSQELDTQKFWAIFFFIACVLILSFEEFKKSGSWDFSGIMYAALGMLLDGAGLLITRYNYDKIPDLTPMEANFYRCMGAVALFMILSRIKPFHLFKNLQSMSLNSKGYVTLGAFLGTFVSLGLYLTAIKTGHLATLTALTITSTIFSATFECIIHKRLPSKYLLFSFIFFLGGMYFISMQDLF